MQNRNVGERLRAAGDHDLVISEKNLIGRVGDRLVRRRAGAADRVRLAVPRQHRHQRYLARDVRRGNRRHDGPVDDALDEPPFQARALNELGHGQLAKLDRGEPFEHRARASERRADTGDDCDAAARRTECWHAGNSLTFEPMQGQLPTRAERFAALGARGREFDLLVIGGGITGCGIAREAAARGLTVALVEKSDFASGTSSRSSRLIHGGVRYLEHGQIRLVFESSAERRRLLHLAPHLVRPLAFTWPVYAGARIPRWKLGLGLTAYDALALFRNVRRHTRLSARGVLAREPGLTPTGLRGGALYYDAATDDARLTLANAIGAAEMGAVVLNHTTVRSLAVRDARVSGARVHDELTGNTVDVRAAVVVNATGPWSDTVRSLDSSAGPAASRKAVRGSKGTHIAIRRERVGNNDALTLLSPMDGRVMFVLPAGAFAIVGTTDTFTTASPDEVRATADDVSYLLATANRFFPAAKLTADDVVAAWAGIRPLLPSAGETPSAASREHAVAVSGAGLVSISGGKLTTYRVMAADVLRVVVSRARTSARRRRSGKGAAAGRRHRFVRHARGRDLPRDA